MRSIKKLSVAVLAVLLMLVARADAGPYVIPNGQIIDIEYWAGTGPNEAVVVVDFFQDADDVFAFGYRWDGVADGGDALTTIAAAGALEIDVTNWGGDPPEESLLVDSMSYDGHVGVNDWFGTGLFWAYWIDDDLGVGEFLEWADPVRSMSQRELVDGSFDGWSFAVHQFGADWTLDDATAPRLPLYDGADVIPEPITAALLAAGLCGLGARRWRRRA